MRGLDFTSPHCHLWLVSYVAFFGGGGGRLSQVSNLFPLSQDKSPKQLPRKRKNKVSVWLFTALAHKQQSGIKGVVGAQDLISARFLSHKHPFSCPGPRHHSLCAADAWSAMEWPATLLSVDPTTTNSDPSSLENPSSFMLEIFGPKTVPDLTVKCNSMEQRGLA